MKKGVGILVLAIVAGIGAFYAMRWHKGWHASQPTMLMDTMPELDWLKSELHLSDSQFEKVTTLHKEYRPTCQKLCCNIAMARQKVDALTASSHDMTPELSAALKDYARVRAECQEAMLRHLYQTAAVLDPAQARQYLDTMVPFAFDTAPPCQCGRSHGQ